METKTLIASDLLKIKAVFLRPEEPFTWASGIKSPIYCDNRLTLTAPEVRTDVENALAVIAASILLASGITLSDGRCLLPAMGFSGIATGSRTISIRCEIPEVRQAPADIEACGQEQCQPKPCNEIGMRGKHTGRRVRIRQVRA